MGESVWELLEQDAPAGCAAVQDLYSWSLNYDGGKGPFTLFLDLIGYSDERFGESLFIGPSSWGIEELRRLSAALVEYVADPYGVTEYVERFMQAEAEA